MYDILGTNINILICSIFHIYFVALVLINHMCMKSCNLPILAGIDKTPKLYSRPWYDWLHRKTWINYKYIHQ